MPTALPNGNSTAVAVNGHSKGDADVRNRAGISKYTEFWNKDSAQDTEEQNKQRIESYEELVNGYYDGATQLYEYGWCVELPF